MERNGRIWSTVLTAANCLICLWSCSIRDDSKEFSELKIELSCPAAAVKALMPDEHMISDVSLMIFNEDGTLEKQLYTTNGNTRFDVSLLKGVEYSILACANFGYQVHLARLQDKESIEYHLAYPDEYRKGIPMSAYEDKVILYEDTALTLGLERLMARIDLKMDRSLLQDSIRMDVTGVRIGNCPKMTNVFRNGRVKTADECFSTGFRLTDIECTPLNTTGADGISGTVSLYMLENLQGTFSDQELKDDNEKVFEDNDPRKDICSYIEMEIEYTGPELASTEKPLLYRFYLGDSINSLDIRRNTNYRITVCPENDGLHHDGWRVDKSGLGFIGVPRLEQYPGDYIVGNIGDRIHIGCILTPSYAPFDVGIGYLEADKAAGIYEYETDPDGHGVTLTLTGAGRGLVYMEAGQPINDAALFVIEVNLPR